MIIAHSERVGMSAEGGVTMRGTTVKVATADPALFSLVVSKAPAGSVLMYEPPTAAVTLAVSVQLPLAGIERPAGKVTVEPPATATGTPPPPQVVLTFGVAAITTPLGKVSTSGAVRVAPATLGLLKVTVSVETPPVLMVALRRSREVDRLRLAGVTQGRNARESVDPERDQEPRVIKPRCS
jgi:hypothetical protein